VHRFACPRGIADPFLPMPPILSAAGLTKVVTSGDAPLTILDRVSFDIEPGASVAIVGASGSGKTTLLGLLAGLDRPTEGDVRVDGTALSALDEDARAALRQRLLGFVFQSFQLLPALTALENVMLPLELAGAPDAVARARTWLDRVGLAKRTTHYPKQLSGGEQQRVAIARAFAGEPKLLMADEPTGNLDAATGVEVADLMFRLNREHGTTLVLVTHDATLAARCARRLSLASGRLVGDERLPDVEAA
jgi:putative ABC transport system ATP-binding protein